jgi:thymidylate synthase
MKVYLDLLKDVLENGVDREDRTKVGTRSVFGRQIRFDLQKGFPLLTTKKIHLKSVVYELLWFLKGETNNRWLSDKGVGIWRQWADDDGSLGPIYGAQWRSWPTPQGEVIDQISKVLEDLRQGGTSRRMIVSAWNPSDLPDESISPIDNVRKGKMALAPCHCLFQFYLANNKLSCQLYQRSADLFLGVPFNIASYALLVHLIANTLHLDLGEYVHTFGDLHLYHNHINEDIVYKQLQREPLALPNLFIKTRREKLEDYLYEDILFDKYQYSPAIKAPIAI